MSTAVLTRQTPTTKNIVLLKLSINESEEETVYTGKAFTSEESAFNYFVNNGQELFEQFPGADKICTVGYQTVNLN